MVNSPFELYVELKTPMKLGAHPLRVDGLMWHALHLHHGCPQVAASQLKNYFSDAGGFFHASACLFAEKKFTPGDEKIDRILGLTRSTVGTMRTGPDLSESLFAPNGKKVRYTRPLTGGGPYKNRLDTHKTYMAQGLIFHGVGDGQGVANMIDFYVTAVGLNASIGFGTIGSVYCKDLDQDLSLLGSDGLPARPLPVDHEKIRGGTEDLLISEAILNPPFRHQATVKCVMPERIRTQKIKIPYGEQV